MARWKSITVETRREAVDAVSHFFTTQGALGMAYDEQLYGPDGDPADPLPPPDEVELVVWGQGAADWRRRRD